MDAESIVTLERYQFAFAFLAICLLGLAAWWIEWWCSGGGVVVE